MPPTDLTSEADLPAYAELYCLSNFSFLRGASYPEELVQQAKALGYQALAITDECSVAGVAEAYVAAQAADLPLLIGSSMLTSDQRRLILLAPTRTAYGQLCQLITTARRRSPKGQYLLKADDVTRIATECLIIWLPTRQQCQRTESHWQTFANALRGRLWIGLENNLQPNSALLSDYRQALADALRCPSVACGHVYAHKPERQPLQDILTAIREQIPVQAAGFNLLPNREHSLRCRAELAQRFSPDALAQTLVIANRCQFCLSELRYEYPAEVVPPGLNARTYLAQLVDHGAQQRWPGGTPGPVRQQLDKELALIAELHYEYYFLTVYDIVQFARSQGILCQGRGSAANSAVCFCLFITEVDPARSRLLFERFISRERKEPPDIDVDFEHERREEVIQFIYRKYGRQRAALAATIIRYRLRSAVRDVGRALGFDASLLDRLGQCIAWWDKPGQLLPRLESLGIDPHSTIMRQFIWLVQQLVGFPRHLSQHVGGFIIAAGPLDQLVPIENTAMPDRTVVQWDKNAIEALGLMKIDVLALGMLSAIRKSFQLIAALRGQHWTLATLPAEDSATYEMLQAGDSMGVFQVESRAQMAMLPRLRPACFYDLVIEVAIVRPGPIQGDMVHPYLKRRQGLESVEYASPAVQQVLERTLGVPIFQEQVIELAMVAAGFSAGEADQLRRAMAAWKRRGQLEPHEEKLKAGLLARHYSEDFARRIVAQIRGFGEYGFPESHAASFALLVYASAWLKCHEPAAFFCALLNSQPMGFYSPSQLVQQLRRQQIQVNPVDINHSRVDHCLEHESELAPTQQPTLRLGLRQIRHLSRDCAARIECAQANGLFKNLEDFMQRVQPDQKALAALTRANALRSLQLHRHQAYWEIQGLQPASPLLASRQPPEHTLALNAPSEAQDICADYHSLGLTLERHPMALLRQHPLLRHHKRHSELQTLPNRRFVRIAGLVTGRQRPGSANGALFLTLEDETGNSNVVVWKDRVERFRAEVMHARLLRIKGVLERQGDVMHVVAGEICDSSHLLGTLLTRSRDFH